MEAEIAIINGEQLKVVKKLEEVLNILKHSPITNQESLEYINKPLDDLLSSLKYLPTDPPFSFLPTEIKTDILSYLCNSGTLVASSVCQEWKAILAPKVDELAEVEIGKHCSNEYECEDGKCFLPEAMINAFATMELDVLLSVCHPLTEVDPQVLGEGLASASNLYIEGNCTECVGDNHYDRKPILTSEQKEQLLVALENRSKPMNRIALRAIDLNNLDQDRLVNCLINKTYYLELDERDYGPILDIRKLVGKLKASTDHRLRGLSLDNVQCPEDLTEDIADALCQVSSVDLWSDFRLKTETMKRILLNILTRPTKTLHLRIFKNFYWSTLIEPDDLKTIVDKMKMVNFFGFFTPEQLQAARSCPGVNVSSHRIIKELDF